MIKEHYRGEVIFQTLTKKYQKYFLETEDLSKAHSRNFFRKYTHRKLPLCFFSLITLLKHISLITDTKFIFDKK